MESVCRNRYYKNWNLVLWCTYKEGYPNLIEIQTNNCKYLVGGIYRVPNTNLNIFIEHYFNSLIEPLKSSHKLFILGDYNVNLLKDDCNKNNFEICMQSNYSTPTIMSATRICSNIQDGIETITETLIDNIFINHNMKYASGLIEISITDHYAVYIFVPGLNVSNTPSTTIQYRSINYKSTQLLILILVF